MCLCYLFSAKTARQLVNRRADFFCKTNIFESIRITNRIESIRIANWNALVRMPTPVANFPPVSSGDSVGLWPVKHDAYCYARSRCLAAVVLKTRMLLLW